MIWKVYKGHPRQKLDWIYWFSTGIIKYEGSVSALATQTTNYLKLSEQWLLLYSTYRDSSQDWLLNWAWKYVYKIEAICQRARYRGVVLKKEISRQFQTPRTARIGQNFVWKRENQIVQNFPLIVLPPEALSSIRLIPKW